MLVVEDEFEVREFYATLFSTRKVGFDWEFATTIDEALEMLSLAMNAPYAVVVTDLMLGDLARTGLDIVKWIREHQIDSRIITMSGYDEMPLTLPGKLLGIDATLEKPLGVPQLVGCIEELLLNHAK